MTVPFQDVCVLIPTLNEAPTIGKLVRSFRELGFPHILIVDGRSTDGTPEIAAEAGAEVLVQTGKGKGNAIVEALRVIKQPYILMLDGDGTYLPDDAEQMLKPLSEGAQHVIGDRMAYPEEGAFTRLNRMGNHLINYLFKVAHGVYLSDILSGYRAFTAGAAREMELKETGFEIETEIAVEAVRNGQKIAVVPIHYVRRPGSPTKLNPFKDGYRIIKTIYRLARRNNPMFYFGIIGIILVFIGGLMGVYVVLEWLNNIEHLPMTVLTVLLITVGFEIFMFGVISDMMLTFHREMMREIQQLRPPKQP
ncbi:MAG: S-layer glycoprotein N-glycosyltransferase AglJ [Methanoculleaceae archaeon]